VVTLPLLACEAWKRLKIDAYMLLIITSTSETPFNNVNVNNLEWPWTPKIGGFSVFCIFFAIFDCEAHTKSIAWKWLETDKGNLRTGTAKALVRSCATHELCSNYLYYSAILLKKINIFHWNKSTHNCAKYTILYRIIRYSNFIMYSVIG